MPLSTMQALRQCCVLSCLAVALWVEVGDAVELTVTRMIRAEGTVVRDDPPVDPGTTVEDIQGAMDTDQSGQQASQLAPAALAASSSNCQVSPYSAWSDCPVTCGGGTHIRQRFVETPATGSGTECPDLFEEGPCNPTECPVACEVSEWTPWSKCSAPCDGGTRTRERVVTVQNDKDGLHCPDLSQLEACNTDDCGAAPALANAADADEQAQRQTVQDKMQEDSKALDGLSASLQDKSSMMQTTDQVSDSDAGSVASTVVASSGSTVTDGASSASDDDGPVGCQVGGWGEWSMCTVSCGTGLRSKERQIDAPAMDGGAPCPELNIEEQCNVDPCPASCQVSEWEAWSKCNKPCGGGEKSRQRRIIEHPTQKGYKCPSLEQIELCNLDDCPFVSPSVWDEAQIGASGDDATNRVKQRPMA